MERCAGDVVVASLLTGVKAHGESTCHRAQITKVDGERFNQGIGEEDMQVIRLKLIEGEGHERG